jgi:hypothetical protein
MEIAEKARKLIFNYTRKVDLELEEMVMRLYGISEADFAYIRSELNRLPNLSAVNQMKIADGELCLDT